MHPALRLFLEDLLANDAVPLALLVTCLVVLALAGLYRLAAAWKRRRYEETRFKARPGAGSGPREDPPYEYQAFASYSTDPDYRLVKRTKGFLESFHLVPTPDDLVLRKLAVCMDGIDFHLPRRPGPAREGARQ
jgi:hypothetical protein